MIPTLGSDGHDPASTIAAEPTRVHLSWRLPRRPATVSFARHLLDAALALLGVAAECRAEIAVALTEACSNAVVHADGADEYRVLVTTDYEHCVIEVIDDGPGFDHRRIGNGHWQATDEHGRGLWMIRACTDVLELRDVDPRGLAVRMTKRLVPADPAV